MLVWIKKFAFKARRLSAQNKECKSGTEFQSIGLVERSGDFIGSIRCNGLDASYLVSYLVTFTYAISGCESNLNLLSPSFDIGTNIESI